MSYKTIIVLVDEARHASERVRHAAGLAIRFDAHLVGSAFTATSLGQAAVAALQQIMPPPEAVMARSRLAAALDRFDAIASSEGVLSIERRLQDGHGDNLALDARCADLAVVSQFDPDDPAYQYIPGSLPEQVVLVSGRPVLILPHKPGVAKIGSCVLIAWDSSLAATRAVYQALPLLRGAARCLICAFSVTDRSDHAPAAELAKYLGRHGVACETQHCAAPLTDGAQLLDVAASLAADLIVMGCYGRSHFRELMLGGITETILRTATVPVLMSH